MRVLLTGASSFTGAWFAWELAKAGHEVVATFRRKRQEYAHEPRCTRVAKVLEICRGVFECGFGESVFLDLARRERWDLLCHHAAEVTDYKSLEFDLVAALQSNIRNLGQVLEALRASGGGPRVVLTGSIFENDEGAGSEGLPAFSPYGLSKSFTYQAFRYYARRARLPLGKFVIPNPFGPFEEPRFTAYLMKTWFAGQRAVVSSPAYVRDNIHVSLLAKVYAYFAQELPEQAGLYQIRPSGYAESQGAFTLRFAAEMRERLGLACAVELAVQTDFAEPRVRINTDPPDTAALHWDEQRAWDQLAAYYGETYRS